LHYFFFLLRKLNMIISFKYKFIFVKPHKAAGSSIESYLHQYLTDRDILASTEDHKGINCWGDFDKEGLDYYFGEKYLKKKIEFKLKYFAHMPIWLIKERLKPISSKINYDIFKNFYKFGVIRNPFDTIVSYYYWRNSIKNKNSKPITFKETLKELESNKYPNYGLLNLNKLMDKNFDEILCDKIIKYEDLNQDLSLVFDKLGIPFDGKLKIFKKKSNRNKNYKKFFDKDSEKLIKEIFWKDIEMFNYSF